MERSIKNEDTDKVFEALDNLFSGTTFTPSSLALVTNVDKVLSDGCILTYLKANKLKPVYRTDKHPHWTEDLISLNERNTSDIYVAFKKL